MTGDLIKKHEGLRLWVYTDTAGKKTIGYGFNLQAAGARQICQRFGLDYDALFNGRACLAIEQAEAIFNFQLGTVEAQAVIAFPGFAGKPEPVQEVICDLLFNMGWATFQEFQHTITAFRTNEWAVAAQHLENSLWYQEVGSRGKEDVALLRSAAG